MTSQHPITPPPELLQQWAIEYWGNPGESISEGEKYMAIKSAQWSADQELEACCEWLENQTLCGHRELIPSLRRLRRPEPQTLNSVALQMLGTIERDAHYIPEITTTIRRALEALND